MKKRALRKDFYMEIRKSLSRFLSIVLIVALGVAFYSGIQSAAPDMKYSGDAYFDENSLMDLKVISTLGLSEENVEALAALKGISKAEPGYMTDVLCGEEQKVLHLESISPTLNKMTAVEGRMPETSGECFVDLEFLKKNGYQVGDTLVFQEEDEENPVLKKHTYTIVGAGSSPLYISFSRGYTTLGNGELSGVGYLLPEDFDMDVYTQVYMEVKGAGELTAYTDAYDTLIARVMEEAEAIEGAQCEIRYREVIEEANEKLSDAREELADGKAEGESELSDAREELLDGEKEIAEAETELADARAEILDGERELLDGEQEIADNKALLVSKQQELDSGRAKLLDGRAQLKKGKKELKAKEKEFKTQYEAAMAEFTAGERALADAKGKSAAGWQQYQNGVQEYEAGRAQYEAGAAQYEAGAAQYEAGKSQYEAGEAAYGKALADYQTQADAWEGQKNGLLAQRAELEGNRTQLEQALQQMQGQLDGLYAGKAEVESRLAAARAQVENENAAVAESQNRIGELEGRKTLLEQEIAALQGQLETVETEEEKAALQSQIDSKNGEVTNLVNQELPAAQGKLQERQEALAAAQNQAAAIEGELPGWDTNIAALQGQMQAQQQNLRAAADGIAAIDAGIREGDGAVAAGRQQLDDSRAQLDATKTQLETAKTQMETSKAQLEAIRAQLDPVPAQLEASKQQLEAGDQQIAVNEQKLADGKQKLADGEKELEKAKKTISANEKKLNASQAQIDSGQNEINNGWQKIADAEKDLEDGRRELADGRREIADGELELADAKQELADGWKEYEDGVKEFEEKIADGEQKIADAKQEIADIQKPEWIISDRSDLPENIGYGENADRMRSLGEVFPVMFFLVAALISLTTMTRMVEEERTQIGTMKALGYGKAAIASKYIVYAVSATLIGSILGVLLGEKLLPMVIVLAYKIMYVHMPHVVIPYNMKYALIATGAALFATTFATVSACYRELSATPAVLMRPPAPKEGKRVFLERITFLWNPLSFLWKSTARNLFRYKKRFFMTIFGIGGCMALMLVGYGLSDSISGIANLQYTELQVYDGMVIVDEDATAAEKEELLKTVDEEERVESHIQVYLEKEEIHIGKKNLSIYIMVPENVEELSSFVNFRSRTTGETYQLTEEGAIITEKIADMAGIEVGDCITIEDEEFGTKEIPVAAITENYMGHYLYLTPDMYEQYFGETALPNQILYRTTEEAKADVFKVGESFLSKDGALSISYTSSTMEQINHMLSALDSVMIVLIISAGLLAFVVLYNLNNININERKRELATIKVLGFYDGEVSAYVYRENILITILGILAGAGMGMILHRFTITTVEVDICMFGRNINPPSFLIAAAFTAGFSIFVNVVMHFKLKKIDMVESLKSVE